MLEEVEREIYENEFKIPGISNPKIYKKSSVELRYNEIQDQQNTVSR